MLCLYPPSAFTALVEENPWLILHFTQVISDRLYEGNQKLSKIQSAFNAQIESLFHAQPPAQQGFLTRTAILTALDLPIVHDLLDRDDTAAVLADLAANGAFVSYHDGVLSYLEAVREFLLARLTAELGVEGVRSLHRRAAELYEQAGRWDQAINHYLDAEEFRVAAQLLAAHVDKVFTTSRFDLLRSWLNRLPEHVIAGVLPALPERMEQALHPKDADAILISRRRRFVDGLVSERVRGWVGAAIGIAAGLGIWTASPLDGLNIDGMRMLALLAFIQPPSLPSPRPRSSHGWGTHDFPAQGYKESVPVRHTPSSPALSDRQTFPCLR